jgi:transposase
MKHVTTIGIDLAKKVFQLCGTDRRYKLVFNRAVRRGQLLAVVREYPDALFVMEACATSHYWARTLTAMGLNVVLIPAQHVKAFTRGNKNDAKDALAIAEAAHRPGMHGVPVKSCRQQDMQTLLRIRSGYVASRTALVNQVRGLLAEYGVVMPRGVGRFRQALPAVLADAENGLTPRVRAAMGIQYQAFLEFCDRIRGADGELREVVAQDPICRRLVRLRGIGPMTAVALYASVGGATQFRNGRQFAAWLGLVPKHTGTGGKVTLGPMSKRGDRALRTLLVHGARSVLTWAHRRDDEFSRWALAVAQRRGKHKATVAIANKTARMVWVALTRGLDALPRHHLSTAV